jgi:hypothetical protein
MEYLELIGFPAKNNFSDKLPLVSGFSNTLFRLCWTGKVPVEIILETRGLVRIEMRGGAVIQLDFCAIRTLESSSFDVRNLTRLMTPTSTSVSVPVSPLRSTTLQSPSLECQISCRHAVTACEL